MAGSRVDRRVDLRDGCQDNYLIDRPDDCLDDLIFGPLADTALDSMLGGQSPPRTRKPGEDDLGGVLRGVLGRVV